jgi:hypothetical protein
MQAAVELRTPVITEFYWWLMKLGPAAALGRVSAGITN